MSKAGSTTPTHNKYQAVGTTDDVDLFDFFDASDKGYQDYQRVSASEDADNLKLSGFNVIFDISDIQIIAVDSINLVDLTSIEISITEDLSIAIAESTDLNIEFLSDDSVALVEEPDLQPDPGFFFAVDSVGLKDEAYVDIDVVTEESIVIDEPSVLNELAFDSDDSLNLSESSNVNLDVVVDEPGIITATESIDLDIFRIESLNLVESGQYRNSWLDLQFSTVIQVPHYREALYTTEVIAKHYTPAPINDIEHPDNPFEPTVVVNGQVIVEHSSTTRGASGNGNYYSIREESILPGCDIKTYSLDYRYGGGIFSIQSKLPFADVGQIVQLFGLKCLVTDIDEGSSDEAGDDCVTSGLIGDSRQLSKELLLVLDVPGVGGLNGLIPVSSPTSLQWTTVSEAAKAIADFAGIPLLWLAADAPLTEIFLETGTLVVDAINSLASRVNAFLTFDGNNTWIVTDPITGYGGWTGVPSCGLFGTRSFRVQKHLDMRTGFVSLPITPTGSSGVTDMTSIIYAPPPIVEHLQGFGVRIESDQAPGLVPLPGDWGETYIQIHLPTINSGTVSDGAVERYVPGTQLPPGVVAVPNSTKDPQQWFKFGFPIYKDKRSGKEYAVVTSQHFHEDLIDQQFSLNVGYTRRVQPLQDAFSRDVSEAIDRRRAEEQFQQERIRYFNQRTARIQFAFFGSLPVPGNKVSLSFKTKAITGTVESVNISKDTTGIPMVNLVVRDYAKFNLLNPRAILDWYLLGGA